MRPALLALGLGGRTFGRRQLAVLALAAFLPLAGTSLSGLPGLTGAAPAVDISAIPHLAAALGIGRPARTIRLVPVKSHTAPTTTTTPVVVSQPSKPPVVISFGPNGQSSNTLAVGALGLLPGSVAERTVTLDNEGALDISAISLVASTSTPNPLVSNPVDGLQVEIQRCSVAWTPIESGPGEPTFSCGGSEAVTSPVAVADVLRSPVPIAGLRAVAPAGVDYLVVVLSFPTQAPATLAGLSTVIRWSFDATAT